METIMNELARHGRRRAVQLTEHQEPVLFKALSEAAAKEDRTPTNMARLYIKRGLREDGYEVENAA